MAAGPEHDVPPWLARAAALGVVILVAAGLAAVQTSREGGLIGLVRGGPDAEPWPADRPRAGREEAGRRLDEPSLRPKARSSSYLPALQFPGADAPVSWPPCRPIHYVLRTDNAPPGAVRALRDGLRQVAAATGLVFVDDGTTDEAPSMIRKSFQPDRYGDRWAPILIAWRSEAEAKGVTGAPATQPQLFQPKGGRLAFVSGFVYFDAQAVSRLQGPQLESEVLHELGHLVGLAHVQDPTQVMARHDLRRSVAAYQDGDLTGLNLLGRGPCVPQL